MTSDPTQYGNAEMALGRFNFREYQIMIESRDVLQRTALQFGQQVAEQNAVARIKAGCDALYGNEPQNNPPTTQVPGGRNATPPATSPTESSVVVPVLPTGEPDTPSVRSAYNKACPDLHLTNSDFLSKSRLEQCQAQMQAKD